MTALMLGEMLTFRAMLAGVADWGERKAVLAAGGSKSYAELLQPFGLDARDPAFWSIGLSAIERMIGELEAVG